MMRVIDAALLESKINEFIADDVNDIKHQQYREGAKYAVKRIRKIIQDVHTLDVQPVVHAEWIYSDKAIFGNPYGRYICSNCGNAVAEETFYRCNCGAKLDKEKSNEKIDT